MVISVAGFGQAESLVPKKRVGSLKLVFICVLCGGRVVYVRSLSIW
jgi:hypothetical protein